MYRLLYRLILPVLVLTVTLLSPGLALAAASDCPAATSSRGQVLTGIGETGRGKCDQSGVTKAIKAATEILSFVVGAIAIIMIILGGFKYITSGGDTNKVANAKSTLVYALVGLAIAALAQFLVHFVLNGASATVTQ